MSRIAYRDSGVKKPNASQIPCRAVGRPGAGVPLPDLRGHRVHGGRDGALMHPACYAVTSPLWCDGVTEGAPMSKSNAERQAEYRRRHLHDPEGKLERINVLVSLQAKRQLERLASYYGATKRERSEEHTSELQSRQYLVCRLLLEKKKKESTRKQNKRLYCYMQKGFDIVYRVTTTANSSTSHTPDTLTCVTHTPLTLYNCIRHSLS